MVRAYFSRLFATVWLHSRSRRQLKRATKGQIRFVLPASAVGRKVAMWSKACWRTGLETLQQLLKNLLGFPHCRT